MQKYLQYSFSPDETVNDWTLSGSKDSKVYRVSIESRFVFGQPETVSCVRTAANLIPTLENSVYTVITWNNLTYGTCRCVFNFMLILSALFTPEVHTGNT